ncbi:MAG: sn-glycerol-1-phosphate dehydrogenase [Lachnospiraceae bacterium]|nr:sn-glycerol-1-phosphate dehydrogenase [Lachnospiraceae bacterium]
MSLADLSLNELITVDYNCKCGRHHHMAIDHLAVGKGAVNQLPDFLHEQKMKDGTPLTKQDKIFVVADIHTWKVAGETVYQMVKEDGYPVEYYIFPHEEMHTNEIFIDELAKAMSDDVKLPLAVGSGTINDLTRLVSFQRGIPYYIIGTAPSMDGFATDVAPATIKGLKCSLPAHCASGIIGDTDLLSTAPDKMIAAGIGDIIAKYIAINDWRLSYIINGEYYCEEVAELMLKSTDKVAGSVNGLVTGDSDAYRYLMECLVLIGIAMGYVNNSRPGSGAEHSMGHVLEMKCALKGLYGELHGTSVGMATCVMTEMYKKFLTMDIDYEKARKHAESFNYDEWAKEIRRVFGTSADSIFKVYEKAHQSDPDVVKHRIDMIQQHEEEILSVIRETVRKAEKAPEYIGAMHGMTSPKEYKVFTKEEFTDILRYTKEQRDRYAGLQFFYDLGVLDELIDYIIEKYYE